MLLDLGLTPDQIEHNNNVAQSATPPVQPVEKPTFGQVVSATWDKNNVWTDGGVKPRAEYINDTNFDFKTYPEEFWPVINQARNVDHAAALINQYEKDKANNKIIESAGFVQQQIAALAVGATNPLNFIAGPEGALGKGLLGKAANLAVSSAVSTAGTEAILNTKHTDRTGADAAETAGVAAVIGGATAVAGHFLGPVLSKGLKNLTGEKVDVPVIEPDTSIKYPAPDNTQSGMVSGGAAVVNDIPKGQGFIKLEPIAGLSQKTTDTVARIHLPTKLTATQRLSTSTLDASRQANNVLFRTAMSTTDNVAGEANQIPVEVANQMRQSTTFADLEKTYLTASETWFKKVESNEYNKTEILNFLKAHDPDLDPNYQVNRTTFRDVAKIHLYDDTTLGNKMPEIGEYLQAHKKTNDDLGADQIDFGLAKKHQLEDITTGKPLIDPRESVEATHLAELKKQRAEIADEMKALKTNRVKKGPFTEAEKAERKTLKDRLDGHEKAIEDQTAKMDKLKKEYDEIIPNSKTHRYQNQYSLHFLSRLYDKPRIQANKARWIDDVVKGLLDKNPELDAMDPDIIHSLTEVATVARDRLLGLDSVNTMGELIKNIGLDTPGRYVKDRTLKIDDKFLTNFTHPDILQSQKYYLKSSIYDVELARRGHTVDSLLSNIDREADDKITALAQEHGVNSSTFQNAREKIVKEAKQDKEEIIDGIRRIKGQSYDVNNTYLQGFDDFAKAISKTTNWAMLGMSAVPNSLGDFHGIGRNAGHARMGKSMMKLFDDEFMKVFHDSPESIALMSEFQNANVLAAHTGDLIAESLNPNKGYSSQASLFFKGVSNKIDDTFGNLSLIQPYAKFGRTVSGIATMDKMLKDAEKGWANLSPQARTDYAKFYIDENTMNTIAEQFKLHGLKKNGMYLAESGKWTDANAARIFQNSHFAQVQHSLNLPGAGMTNKFLSGTPLMWMTNKFQSFNQAAYESTMLQSMQNKDASRLLANTLTYFAYGFLPVYLYDVMSGRDHSMEKYWGSPEATALTMVKILTKGGYVAATSDAAVWALKALGSDINPASDAYKSMFGKWEQELFPKYGDIGFLEKVLGPTYAQAQNIGAAGVAVANGIKNGEFSEKDIAAIRRPLPGQNIAWARRAIDHLEEYAGGRPADRNANR